MDFWTGYLSLSFALILLGSAYAVRVAKREFLAFVLIAFYAAEVAWMATGFGNPSARYLYVTVPGLTILAGIAVSDIAAFLGKTTVRTRTEPVASRTAAVVAAGLLILVVGAAAVRARANTDPGA